MADGKLPNALPFDVERFFEDEVANFGSLGADDTHSFVESLVRLCGQLDFKNLEKVQWSSGTELMARTLFIWWLVEPKFEVVFSCVHAVA